jgi:hypothetical protein
VIINLDTIWGEIRAADPTIIGSPLTIGADGTLGNLDQLTPAQQTIVQTVIAAHNPTKPDPKAVRETAILADSNRADFITRLLNNDLAAIDAYIDANVALSGATVAALRTEVQTILRAMLKKMARAFLLNVTR